MRSMYYSMNTALSTALSTELSTGLSTGSTINIFDDEIIGGSSLSFRPESTTTLANELLPPTHTDERFQQNALLNGKTKYEETNTIIQSLEEEIVRMKHKLSFVYEKDEEIAKLKDEIIQLKKELSELQKLQEEVVSVRLTNQKLLDELEQVKRSSDSVSDSVSETKQIKEEPWIDINIQTIRSVLMKRLQDKQTEHINQLISEYELDKKDKVKRSTMQQMLEKAIHL